MPTYSFSFYPEAAGLPYVVKNRAGVEVESGTLPSGDDVTVTHDLPWDSYYATTEIESGPYQSTRQFSAAGEDVTAGGGGGGTTEVAYFQLSGTGNTDYVPADMTVTALSDPADWWDLASDTVTINEPCILAFWYEMGGEFDYGDVATVPDIYYTASGSLHKEDGHGVLAFELQGGLVMPEGATATASGIQPGYNGNNGSFSAGADEGTTFTFTAEAGTANSLDAGTADFSARVAIVKLHEPPTFPEA